MRWILTALVVAVFASVSIAPQAAWADQHEGAKEDVEQDVKDAKEDVEQDVQDAREDAAREKRELEREKKLKKKHYE